MKAARQAVRSTPRRRGGDDGGFMMVAILIGLGIAAIWLTAALPYWPQQAQRQKEEDLIFRGEQYARAIVLFQNKYDGANPPDIDTLVSQHFLRKKWKDPITKQDFIPVGLGVVAPPGQTNPLSPIGQQTTQQTSAPINSNGRPGVSGVRSASTATSIKVYQNQQQYSLWAFDAQLYRVAHGMQAAPGSQGGGRQGGGRQGGGDGRGGQGIGPGGARGGGPGRAGGGPGRGGDAGPGRGGGGTGGRGGRGGVN